MLDGLLTVVEFMHNPNRDIFKGDRTVVAVTSGAVAGAVSGAAIGSLSRRWERRFARP